MVTRIKTRSLNPQLRAKLLAELHQAQELSAWLTPESLHEVADRLGLTVGQVFSTASFYSMYKFHPQGRFRIQVCEGLSCYLMGGAEPIIEYINKKLQMNGEDISPDGKYSLEIVQCLAACDLAPAIRVNEDLYGNISQESLDELLSDLSSRD